MNTKDRIEEYLTFGISQANKKVLEEFVLESEAIRTDYVAYEPFTLVAEDPSDGRSAYIQATLPGQPTYLGYQSMGSRGGYYDHAPNTYGYLQRKNGGISETYYSNLFSFSAGTTIGTAASIMLAAVTSAGVTLVLSVIVALISPVVDVITYDWGLSFEICSFKWLYRIRLNSDIGTIIGENYRTRDYCICFRQDNGHKNYEYRGTVFDEGFLMSKEEMIKMAVDEYLAGMN